MLIARQNTQHLFIWHSAQVTAKNIEVTHAEERLVCVGMASLHARHTSCMVLIVTLKDSSTINAIWYCFSEFGMCPDVHRQIYRHSICTFIQYQQKLYAISLDSKSSSQFWF